MDDPEPKEKYVKFLAEKEEISDRDEDVGYEGEGDYVFNGEEVVADEGVADEGVAEEDEASDADDEDEDEEGEASDADDEDEDEA